MKKERFSSKYRMWIQAAWFAMTNGYLRGYTTGKIYTGPTKIVCFPGLNCYSCPGALYACPIGSLQAVLGSASYRISLYVFGFISLFGALLGRLVCGFLCPFGLVQDLLYKIPLGAKKKNLPGHRYISKLRYVILVLFVFLLSSLVKDVTGSGAPWFCEWICPSGTLLAGVPLVIKNPGFQEAIGFRFWWKMTILIVLLVLSVIYYRPFCKYLCPLGALYGLFNPVSTFRIKVDETKCVKCMACQRACGMDIRTFETPNSTECIRCMKCVSACPKEALDTTWHLSGKNFADRYLSRDDDLPNTEEKRTVILAIFLLISAGVSLALMLFQNVHSSFIYLLTDVVPSSLFPVATLINYVKLAVCFLSVVCAALLIVKRKRASAVRTAAQSMAIGEIVYLIAVVIFVIQFIFQQSIASIFVNQLLTSSYPFLSMLWVTLTLNWLDRIVHGEKKAGWGFRIFYGFTLLITALPIIALIVMYFIYG